MLGKIGEIAGLDVVKTDVQDGLAVHRSKLGSKFFGE